MGRRCSRLRSCPSTTRSGHESMDPAIGMAAFAVATGVLGGASMLRQPKARAIAVQLPGWIARRRARKGIQHGQGRVGVGYRSMVGRVYLSPREVAHHGFVI